MDAVASRDLRNHTADVLRRVAQGSVVAVTVHGRVVAELHPPTDHRPRSWTRDEVGRWAETDLADPGLRGDLAELAGDLTTDLDPL